MRYVDLTSKAAALAHPLVPLTLVAAIALAPSLVLADDHGPNLVHVDLGASLSVRRNDDRDHFGFGGAIEYERRLGKVFGIGARVAGMLFPYDEEIFDGSGWATYTGVGPSLRLHLTPGLAHGDLWIGGGAQLVITGDLIRAGADGGLGFDIAVSSGFAIGPFARYVHVFQPSDSQGGPADGRMLLFGLSLRWGGGGSDDDETDDETSDDAAPDETVAADEPADSAEPTTSTDEPLVADSTGTSDLQPPPDELGPDPVADEPGAEPTSEPGSEPEAREPRVREPRVREPREPRVREPRVREPREPRVREPREPRVRERRVREPREPRVREPREPRVREPREPRVREPREPRVREPREPRQARPIETIPTPETYQDTRRFHDPQGDRDADGILNGVDACPSLWGTGQDGCPVVQGNTFGVHMRFETDRAALTDDTVRALLFVLDQIRTDPRIEHVLIVGHADRLGEETYNDDLSLRRAESVLEWFLRRGIPRDRFTIRGVGFSEPLVEGETSDALAPNRRVELFIVDSASP